MQLPLLKNTYWQENTVTNAPTLKSNKRRKLTTKWRMDNFKVAATASRRLRSDNSRSVPMICRLLLSSAK